MLENDVCVSHLCSRPVFKQAVVTSTGNWGQANSEGSEKVSESFQGFSDFEVIWIEMMKIDFSHSDLNQEKPVVCWVLSILIQF